MRDYKTALMGNFVLDGKEFSDGRAAHQYLREECGFTDKEAVQFLVSLSHDQMTKERSTQ